VYDTRPYDSWNELSSWGNYGEWNLTADELNRATSEISTVLDNLAQFIDRKAGLITQCAIPLAIPDPDYPTPEAADHRVIQRTIRKLRSAATQLRSRGFRAGVHPNQLRKFISMWINGDAALDGGDLLFQTIAACLCAPSRTGSGGMYAAGLPDMEGTLGKDASGSWSCRPSVIRRTWGFDDQADAWERSWIVTLPTESKPEGEGGWRWRITTDGIWTVDNEIDDFLGSAVSALVSRVTSTPAPSTAAPGGSAPPGAPPPPSADTILGIKKSLFFAIVGSVGGLVLLASMIGVAKRRQRRIQAQRRASYETL